MRVTRAQDLLGGAGFVVTEQTRYDQSYAPGVVIVQSPEAGAEAAPGSVISLVVSTDAPDVAKVPGVVGLSKKTAIDELEAEGFSAKVVTADKKNKAFAAGMVINQTPDAGAKRPEGSTVTITVNP
jgi:serine/threonine-protein kinase